LATTESFTDRDQNRQERTEWHNVVVWGRTAETVSKYLRKGRQVYVEGKIQTRQWEDREGNKRYTTEVVAQRVLFLGGRGDADSTAQAPAQRSPADSGFGDVMEPYSSDFEGGQGQGGQEGGGSDDDDMPF
jgi:single-strand DNA-binding protein